MIDTPRGRAVLALGFALFVCFSLTVHVAIVDGSRVPAAGAWLSLIPITAIVVLVVRRRHPLIAFLVAAAVFVGVWMRWAVLERQFPSVFFVEHVGVNLALAIVFGRTLLGNREPLCTRFARLLHETLPPDVERYTRQVTLAWTMFFGLVLALSCVLYLPGFLAAWSLFANILSPILIVAMFVGEYLVRGFVLPKWKRTGLLGSIRALAQHFGAAQTNAPH